MLYVKIYEFIRHIETEYQSLMDDTGLNLGEIHVMRSLFDKNGQHPGEIARSVGRPPTSFTPMIDGLVGKDLIERRVDPDDRRALRVYLTVQGEALRQNITQYSEEADEQLEAEMHNFLPIEPVYINEEHRGIDAAALHFLSHQDGPIQPTNVKDWLSQEGQS